ncbi:MAG: glycosyltransferase family 2 protein [Chloroflexota bacterium]
MRPSISLVVPVFNEEENLAHAVAIATRALAELTSDYEVVLVDDASTDRTPEIMRELALADPRVRIVHHESNQKLGGTLRDGFAVASKDLVLYMDADLPFDPREIGRALSAMEVTRADMIAAYRYDRTGEGFRRAVYSYVYNGIIGVLFGWPHRDINFAFKLMRREILEAVELRSEGSLISAELITKAKNLGFTVQQIGLDYFPRTRGRSTLSSLGVIAKIFRELVVLYPEMRHPRRRSPRQTARPAEDQAPI